jgi:TatD DNase family protein
MWFDSHCHIPYEGLPCDALEQARAAGVTRMVSVGTDGEVSRAVLDAAEANDGIWATVGLHPHESSKGVDTVLPLLERKSKLVGIGECGLDYHYDFSPRDAQRKAFAAQVRLANELDLATTPSQSCDQKAYPNAP